MSEPPTTALAIVAHAIPQQVGDFAVLLHSGYSRRRAFLYNLATGVATLAGGLIGAFYAIRKARPPSFTVVEKAPETGLQG